MYKLSNLFRDTEMAIKKNLIKFDRFNQLIEDILVEDDFCHILESTIRFSESACHDVSLLQSGEQTPAVSNTYTNNFQRNTSEVSDFNETADTLAEAMQSELQENVFSGISNFWSVFFEELMKNTISTTPNAQVDFLIQSMELSDDEPQWKDVKVVAEFSKKTHKNARKAKFLKLSGYVREVFCAQPLRRFVHCFFFLKTKFELWVFDRTGAYSSGLKSIVSEKEMFVRAISSYLLMSDEELGLDLSTSKVGENLFVTINGINDDPTMQFKIDPEPIVRSQRLITRVDFLKVALPVRGVVNYITSDEVYRTSEHLGNLDFTDADAWDLKTETLIISRGTHLMQPTVSPWDRDRKLIRIAITPRGQPLNTSKTTLEFIVGIRDAILGHRRLYDRGILHGDISEGNIVLTSPNAGDESKGMLIDLDHSVGLIESLKTDDELSLTGTMKFMAIERLQVAVDNEPTIQRTIRHDLESFFYVFLVGCIEYEVVPESKSRNLDSWCTRDVASNYTSKVGYIAAFEVLVLRNFTPSFLGLKDLASSLKTILFGEIGQNYTTPYDCSSMYEEIIGAFNKTIQQITGKINLRLSKIVIPIDTSLTDKSSITQIDQS
ncbi:BgTH12-01437 [Blumeria graminis f. sp. triticale]|uniref:non-specific serine/threonine protein kinase n=1 Tax=Blumeria graminis f. sp. triticale TaxID=1689686 RepID=A0A9W4CYQ8_BLUGR|nr:BgTH12-01437 [Blumeria graminis f. sp. triticale]